jgi:diguanylate cyclase (GGDEF)-like protein/PAS domain S-box-containing protein
MPLNYVRQRKKVQLFTAVVIVVVTLLATSVTLVTLYRATIDGQEARLTDAAHTLALLMDAVGRFDAVNSADFPGGSYEATLSQIRDLHEKYEGFGKTGEFIIAHRRGEQIEFLLGSRGNSGENLPAVSWKSELAEPMRRALSGMSGTVIGLDYRGRTVLAAFQPIPSLGLGIVAKVEMAEIRAPFVLAAAIASGVALLLALIGALLSRRLTMPLIQRLEEDERRYRTLFNLSPHGVVMFNPQTMALIAFNPAVHKQFGYERDEFAALRVDELDAEGTLKTDQCVRDIMQSGIGQCDALMRAKSGEVRDVHVWAQTMEYGGQNVIYAIFEDVTEQRRAEQVLREHRQQLETLVQERTAELSAANEHLQDEIRERSVAEEELKFAGIVYANSIEGVLVTDAQGTILTVNPAFVEITGYGAEETIGKNPRILRSDHQGEEFFHTMWEQLLTLGRWRGEIWNRRLNGEAYLQQTTITMVRDDAGQPKNYVAVFSDITDLRAKEEKIRHQAYHDALTGLPNRLLFQDRLQQAISHASRQHWKVAVMFLDLDRFKIINDTLGHNVGDSLLQSVSERLAQCLRQEDTVSRFGGDEFVILVSEARDRLLIERIAQKITEAFGRPFSIDGHELNITTSIGISVYPDHSADPGVLLKSADTAMYWAKDCGRNNYQLYSHEMNSRGVNRLAMQTALRYALRRGEFELLFQPRIELRTARVIGAEALLRWHHPERGLVLPEEFIGVAEETNLIVPLGDWALRVACEQARIWQDLGFDLRVSVNISARQFTQPDLLSKIDKILEETGLNGHALELELTESLVMQNAEHTVNTLNALTQRGVGISIDDFGTGYSSLNYLKRFPIDTLKIDSSFIRDIPGDADDAAISTAIINLGHSLRLNVVAEGVETKEQLEFLEAQNCDSIQGYYYYRPLAADEFTRLLESDVRWMPNGTVLEREVLH